MKRVVWLFLIVMFFSINGLAQNEYLPFSSKSRKKVIPEWRFFSSKSRNKVIPEWRLLLSKNRDKGIPEWRYTNLDVTLGYIPKASIQGLKTSLALNNLLFNRLGLFSSLEYGLNSNDLSNIVGGTLTVNEHIYFWGGLDLFTKNGLIQTKSMGIRKEVGIGFIPYKKLVVQVGGSLSVGLTISAGYRITW